MNRTPATTADILTAAYCMEDLLRNLEPLITAATARGASGMALHEWRWFLSQLKGLLAMCRDVEQWQVTVCGEETNEP